MSARVAFIVFFIAAVLLAAIAGLLTAGLRQPVMVIIGSMASTFIVTLSLAMTCYMFVT